MAGKPAQKTQIVISGIPQGLVDEIDDMAERDNRSRSAETVVLLQEIVAEKREPAGVGAKRGR